MKVLQKSDKLFCEIKAGEVFKYGGIFFMKLGEKRTLVPSTWKMEHCAILTKGKGSN